MSLLNPKRQFEGTWDNAIWMAVKSLSVSFVIYWIVAVFYIICVMS